jgi:hypothetical protein
LATDASLFKYDQNVLTTYIFRRHAETFVSTNIEKINKYLSGFDRGHAKDTVLEGLWGHAFTTEDVTSTSHLHVQTHY